jgi:hypothetical protein
VVTEYPGASAAVVENKITELIENRLAGVEGIKTMRSTSYDGESSITLEFISIAISTRRPTMSGIASPASSTVSRRRPVRRSDTQEQQRRAR